MSVGDVFIRRVFGLEKVKEEEEKEVGILPCPAVDRVARERGKVDE